MGLTSKFKGLWNYWTGGNTPTGHSGRRFHRSDPEAMRGNGKTRSFDGADRDDRSESRFAGVDRRTINQLLYNQLQELHERSYYESRNNPIVDSTIDTHARDVVGPDGPSIQVEGFSEDWNSKAEKILAEWAEDCLADGSGNLGDWMRADIRDCWLSGDMLAQIVLDTSVPEFDIRHRIHALDGRGLYMYSHSNEGNAFLGVERNQFRRPTHYHIVDPENSYAQFGYANLYHGKVDRIPAKDILHSFISKERLQIRGYPLLAPALPVSSQLREYDNSVIAAANSAALLSILISNSSEMATIDADQNPETMRINPGGITQTPWGWNADTLDPNQPMPQNMEFRTDRMREIGMPVGMPLIQLRHDASNSNYSSARFDVGAYRQSNKTWQSWMFRRRVTPICMAVLQEAMLLGRLPPRRLSKVKLSATWDEQMEIDPVKAVMAAKLRMELRISSPIEEAKQLMGMDFESVCKNWQKANDLLEKHGQPPHLGPVPSSIEDLLKWMQVSGGTAAGTEATAV